MKKAQTEAPSPPPLEPPATSAEDRTIPTFGEGKSLAPPVANIRETLGFEPASDADDGSRLVAELEKADREADVSNARAAMFESANAPREKPIDARFPRLVERTFLPIDWGKALDRFDAWMSLGDRRTEEGHIRRAHEEGPEIVKAVLDVSIQVQFARGAWELENDSVLGAMREEASKVLEREKERKVRTKMVTEADVAAKCASMFPDEWASQEKRRLQYKLSEERAKRLYELGIVRCRHLESMMSRLR